MSVYLYLAARFKIGSLWERRKKWNYTCFLCVWYWQWNSSVGDSQFSKVNSITFIWKIFHRNERALFLIRHETFWSTSWGTFYSSSFLFIYFISPISFQRLSISLFLVSLFFLLFPSPNFLRCSFPFSGIWINVFRLRLCTCAPIRINTYQSRLFTSAKAESWAYLSQD